MHSRVKRPTIHQPYIYTYIHTLVVAVYIPGHYGRFQIHYEQIVQAEARQQVTATSKPVGRRCQAHSMRLVIVGIPEGCQQKNSVGGRRDREL